MNNKLVRAVFFGAWLMLAGCSSDYSDSSVTIISVDDRSVLYKVTMDSGNYSPGINVSDGRISFPKCPLKAECKDVTFQSHALKFNKYVADIADPEVLKKLKERVQK